MALRHLPIVFLSLRLAAPFVLNPYKCTRLPQISRVPPPGFFASPSAKKRGVTGIDDDPEDIDIEEEEKEYSRKLAEAKAAISAAEDARHNLRRKKRLQRSSSFEDNIPPSSYGGVLGGKSRLSFTDAGTLVLDLPREGLSTSSLFEGAFGIAWFSAVIPATFAAVASGGASVLFLLPFWAAGGMVAKSAAVDPFVGSRLTIGRYAWSVKNTYAGRVPLKERAGPTEELLAATAEVAIVVNDCPRWELRLHGREGVVAKIGRGLPEEELNYVAEEINDYLRSVKSVNGSSEAPEGLA